MSKSKIEWEIVKRVRIKREEYKYSQEKTGEVLGVSRGFIGQIEMETNKSMYSYIQLNKLAIEFKCSIRDFIPEQPIL